MSKVVAIVGAAGVAAGIFMATRECGSCVGADAPAEAVLASFHEQVEPFAIDSVHSSVLYCVRHMNVSNHWGRFSEISGEFAIDPENLGASVIRAEIPVESIDSNNDARDAHLKKTDFFSAAEFPTIRFESTKFTPAGENMFDVQGELTLHGVTRPVTAKVEYFGTTKGRGDSKLSGLEATLEIKRSEFGMSGFVGPVGDDVKIIVSLEGGR